MAGQPSILTLHMPPRHERADLEQAIARKAGSRGEQAPALPFRILRLSLDARDKHQIHWVYRIELHPSPDPAAGVRSLVSPDLVRAARPGRPPPYVIGSGPAGLFAALYLAMSGQPPVVIERGRAVEERVADVVRFWQSGRLDPASNVQFGEGGAGTFSDGKLTTGIKDRRCRAVLEELVLAGAPEEILWLAKPHVGTDRLRKVVRNIREKITDLGGSFRFSCRLAGLSAAHGRLQSIICQTAQANGGYRTDEWPAEQVVLAVGHSARDVYRLLESHHVMLAGKPFSLGVRIEHLQDRIDAAQYGRACNPGLPPADYKLACHLPGGRSVYTFCMCPGGQVIGSASEAEGSVTNGMSLHARRGRNANSALLVGVTPDDFPGSGPLAGMHWQQNLERGAFQLAGSTYAAPAQRVGSFLAPGRMPATEELVRPTCRPGVAWCELADVLPPFVYAALREALPVFDRKLNGFAAAGAVLTGIETRSSSPVRILRDHNLESSLAGLFPAGEGAGYAGGIVSAALDGLRCAQALLAARG